MTFRNHTEKTMNDMASMPAITGCRMMSHIATSTRASSETLATLFVMGSGEVLTATLAVAFVRCASSATAPHTMAIENCAPGPRSVVAAAAIMVAPAGLIIVWKVSHAESTYGI